MLCILARTLIRRDSTIVSSAAEAASGPISFNELRQETITGMNYPEQIEFRERLV